MTPAEFEPTISASERQQTYALNRAAIGTSSVTLLPLIIITICGYIKCHPLPYMK
jgi:hypothetical protein